ncbi:MAG: HD domain-containing protein [Breznakia sp.]
MNKIQSVERYVCKALDNNHDEQMRIIGYVHLFGVAQCASLLAKKRNLNVEMAHMMGLLHDIYTYTKNDIRDHARQGSLLAEQALSALKVVSIAEKKRICHAIYCHSDKITIHGVYDEVLKDADVLAHYLYNPTMDIKVKERKRLANIMRELSIDNGEVDYV